MKQPSRYSRVALCPSPEPGLAAGSGVWACAGPLLQPLPEQGIITICLVSSEPHSLQKPENSGADPQDLIFRPAGPGHTSCLSLPSAGLQVSGRYDTAGAVE